jgi:ABC-type antimicrobial peptide transport system permease subunit
VIRLSLRFSLRGAKEGKVRLILTALGVALAVTLLLFVLSGFNGIKARDAHEGWLLTSEVNHRPSVDESRSDPLWWSVQADRYDGRVITIVRVAPTGPASPLIPGLDRFPESGEYYVSPALAELLAETPPDLLGARFSGTQVGILGKEALTSPESLVLVAGRTAAEMAQTGASQVRSLETAPKENDYSLFLRIVIGIGAIGLMLPVLVFVMTSTRLAAARREERLAALRLVGATPRQVNVIAGVEAVLAAVAGTALGFVFFYAFRPLVARIPFTGEPFFVSDLNLGWLAHTGVALGVPLAAIVAGLWTLRRVQISPLGVTRKAPARRPHPARLLVLIAGIMMLIIPSNRASNVSEYLVFAGFAITVLGIVIAGPWLTYWGGRLLARFARRDATLIAARRLGGDPRRAFRAISGLVLAVFVGTVFLAIIGTALGDGSFSESETPASTVLYSLESSSTGYLSPEESAQVVEGLKALPGVRETVPILGYLSQDSYFLGIVSDADWLLLGGSSQWLNGAGYVALNLENLAYGHPVPAEFTSEDTEVALAAVTAEKQTVFFAVFTDGNQQNIERIRTFLETSSGAEAGPGWYPPHTVAELNREDMAFFNLLGRMVDVGIILCLVIAGCSLAVSVAGGLVERKRAFALLRLTGMPLRHLYWVVLIEAAVPLMLAAALSAGAGFLVAAIIMGTASDGFSLVSPGISYYSMVIGGLAAALGIVAATLPLVGRMTAPETARVE